MPILLVNTNSETLPSAQLDYLSFLVVDETVKFRQSPLPLLGELLTGRLCVYIRSFSIRFVLYRIPTG